MLLALVLDQFTKITEVVRMKPEKSIYDIQYGCQFQIKFHGESKIQIYFIFRSYPK